MSLKTFSGRRASQHADELLPFVAFLQERGVRSYLEIGARHGDTFHEVMLGLPAGSLGVAVDLPGGLWGRSDTHKALERACVDLRARGYIIHMLLGDSTSEFINRSLSHFGLFDAVLIDGDHTYQGVKRDWELHGHRTPVVAFHDIVGADQAEKVHGNAIEVPRLWSEIRGSYTGYGFREFIAPQSKMGIGVLYPQSTQEQS